MDHWVQVTYINNNSFETNGKTNIKQFFRVRESCIIGVHSLNLDGDDYTVDILLNNEIHRLDNVKDIRRIENPIIQK